MKRDSTTPSQLWATGGFTLNITGPDSTERRVVIDRPFGVLGRARGNDAVIQHTATSGRHVYFHLDRRGVFAVDLATRTGTRIGDQKLPWAWLANGDSLEVAGYRVELQDWHLDDAEPAIENELPSPLDDAGSSPLARLVLYPEASPGDPLTLDSRMVFAGRSNACGVSVDCPSATRVHCALIRGQSCGYVVDLAGRGTWLNGSQVKGAAPIHHNDVLIIGTTKFQCRVEQYSPHSNLPALALGVGSVGLPAENPAASETFLEEFQSPPLHLIPVESQAAVLGWMLGQIQARQDESSRRQHEFQTELVRLVADIHRDNQSMLTRHLERSDEIQQEVAKLREEIQQRFLASTPYKPSPATQLPPPPKPIPLKNIPPLQPPDNPEAAVSWLLDRAGQLDQDNQKGWKDLLTRLSGRKPS